MPAMMTLADFLASGRFTAISRYRKTGILPSYVIKPKKLIKKGSTKKKPFMKKIGGKVAGTPAKRYKTKTKTPRNY